MTVLWVIGLAALARADLDIVAIYKLRWAAPIADSRTPDQRFEDTQRRYTEALAGRRLSDEELAASSETSDRTEAYERRLERQRRLRDFLRLAALPPLGLLTCGALLAWALRGFQRS